MSESPLPQTAHVIPPAPPSGRRLPLKILAPVVAVAIGGAAARTLIAAGTTAERGTPPEKIDIVEAVTLRPAIAVAEVQATGTVVADSQVVLMPEVGGKLTWVSETLTPGARFTQGDVLARVDARDTTAAEAAERSRLHQAELELALERNRGEVAAREWKLLGGEGDGTLARREPHLAVAQANLEAARASLERAELNVRRTAIRAPFNAVVLSESADIGQVVGAASQVAVLAGTDRYRVEVSVPFERLATLAVPGVDGVLPDEGSTALVVQRLSGGRALTREGRVIGMGGRLDPQSRTATVLVVVDDPLDPPLGGLPLMVGAFVDVALHGRSRDGTLAIPRTAVYDGDTVWVVDDERLQPREITVGWSLAEEVEITTGLAAGDRVVTTPLSAPIAGTRVRLLGGE